MKTKEEVLKFINDEITKIESELIISSECPPELNDFNDNVYRVLEVARLALRGVYHTK